MTSQVSRFPMARTHGYYILKTARGSATAPLLVGFHGYGESAETELSRLESIPGIESWLLCSIQALHPFYNRRTNEVVASWMTRLNREQAIQDNLAYVSDVLDQVRSEFSVGPVAVYTGFSQGVAMACRTAVQGRPCQGLILLGGDIPPEVKAEPEASLPPVLLGRGRQDEWYTEAKMAGDLEFLAGRKVPVEPVVCRAGHAWNDDFREAAGAFLLRARSGEIQGLQGGRAGEAVG